MFSSIKAIIWTVTGMVCLGALAVIYFGLPQGEQTVYPVALGSVQRTARATGRVEGMGEVTLRAPRATIVDKINVSEGEVVELNEDTQSKGLAQLNTTEADIQVAQATATLQEAQAALEALTTPRAAEVLKQADEVLTQAKEEVKSRELKLKMLKEPALPPKGQPWQIEEAGRAVEKATQNLALAKAAQAQLGATPDDKSVALANFNTAKAELDGAEKLLAQNARLTDPSKKTTFEVKVEVARKNLEKAQAEYERVRRAPPPPEVSAAEARVKLAQAELESANAAKARLEKPEAPPPAADDLVKEAEILLREAQSKERQEQAALDELKLPPLPTAVQAAEAVRDRAQKALTFATLSREALKIRPPFSGLVTRRYVEPGSLVMPDEPILTMLDFSQKRVRVEFDIVRLPELKVGMPVSITCRHLQEKTEIEGAGARERELTGWPLTGRIERILGVGTRKLLQDDPAAPKGGEVFEVLIRIEPPQTELKQKSYALLRPGLRVEVKAVLEERTNVLVIPKSYIFREAADGGDGRVLLLGPGGSGKVTTRFVKCGLKDEQWQEITEGLSKDDRIVKPKSANR